MESACIRRTSEKSYNLQSEIENKNKEKKTNPKKWNTMQSKLLYLPEDKNNVPPRIVHDTVGISNPQ
jgi:hypothetical protein